MRRIVAITFVVLVVAHLGGGAHAAPGKGFQIIVHPSNRARTIESRFLADAFLKRVTHWPDGRAILPVDRDPESQVRATFSEQVLGRTVPAVRSFWQQAIYSGRGLPPPELGSDAQVVAYVLEHQGAVGYVSTGADVGGASVVAVKR